MLVRILVAALSLGLAACLAETDLRQYAVGETGEARFHNDFRATLYLGGCQHFAYEKWVAGEWVAQAPDVVCFWEGLALPVPPGEAVLDPIRAREPGTWRLHYPIGIGCREDAPLSEENCLAIGDAYSNRFEVVGSGCVVTGCSGAICAEDHVASTCEWLPHYVCYQDADCGRFGPGGSCAWDPTPELIQCIEDRRRDPVGLVGLELTTRE